MGRVVVPVEIILLLPSEEAAPCRPVLGDVAEALVDRLVLINAGRIECGDRRRRPRKRREPTLLEIAEPAIGILAAPDEFDALVHRALRHLDACVPRRPQRHDLAYRHRDVGRLLLRLIPPAALVVLRIEDDLHRPP